MLIIAIIALLLPLLPTIPTSSAYTALSPIHIVGDSGFVQLNQTYPGSVKGYGNITHPYVIEGFEILATSGPAIWVEDTRAYFIINACYVHGNGEHPGIIFDNVSHGAVLNTLVEDTDIAIQLTNCRDCYVGICSLQWNNYGVKADRCEKITFFLTRFYMNKMAGLYMHSCSDVSVDGCSFRLCTKGVHASYCANMTVTNCVAFSCSNAILVEFCHNATLEANKATDGGTGISVKTTHNVSVLRNNVSSNTYGMSLSEVSFAMVKSNFATANSWGIWLTDVDQSTLSNNTLKSNTKSLVCQQCSNLTVTWNGFASSETGATIENAIYVNFTGNVLTANEIGLSLSSVHDSIFYNNYFESATNAEVEDAIRNDWNSSLRSGSNIVGGSLIGGNYWSDYEGQDIDGDGIGDSPYAIQDELTGATYYDYLPLVFPSGVTPKPSIRILSPEAGIYMASSEVLVSWTDDPLASYYEVRMDGGEWINVGTATSYKFTDVPEGRHVIEVRVVNRLGKEASDAVSFTVDLTPPEVSIVRIESGKGTLYVVWKASDTISDIRGYAIRIDGGEWIELNASITSYEFKGLDVGKHTVEVKAIDLAGNFATDVGSAVVSMPAPPEAEEEGGAQPIAGAGFNWLPVVVGTIAAAVAVALFLYFRKKKPYIVGIRGRLRRFK